MKISLRKIKSLAIGERYNADFFKPIELPNYCSAVSVSVIGNTTSICKKYGMDYEDSNEVVFSILRKRKIVEVNKKISFIFIPSTQSSNSNSIKKYCEKICELIEFKDYLHFTHFGYLKTSFPSVQIKRILHIFLSKEDFECEVCWDIDEKFFKEMQELLAECLTENNKDVNFDCYDSDAFSWSRDYDIWRESRQEARNQRRLIHNQRFNEEHRVTTENFFARFLQNRRNAVVTRREEDLPNIGAGASGTAGEFYALSLFIRNGFIAGKAPEGTALYDLFVMTSNAFSFAPVQVKTVTNGRHWMLSQRHEDVIENLIFCFVLFSNELTNTRVFLVPSSVVSNAIRTGNEIWTALPGMNGRTRTNGNMRTFKMDFSSLVHNVQSPQDYLTQSQFNFLNEHSMGWLDRYENNFEIFNSVA